MSDELKPCPFCGGIAELIEPGKRYRCYHIHCTNECCIGWKTIEASFLTAKRAIAAWNTRADDAPKQPICSGEDVVAILRKYATFWGVSHATNTQCDSNWEVTTMRALADMIERDYVRKVEHPMDNAQADSREKLEADVYQAAEEMEEFTHGEKFINTNKILRWLDRQAAITERETVKQWEEQASELVCKINKLTAERYELREKLDEKQHVCDVQRDSFLKLEAENAELRKMLADAAEAI